MPFDGADAGFDPRDHTRVDPRLGSWNDVAALAGDGYTVMADVIVNHVSSMSPQFLDWLAKGPESPYDGGHLLHVLDQLAAAGFPGYGWTPSGTRSRRLA